MNIKKTLFLVLFATLCCINRIDAQGKLTFETERINIGKISNAEPVVNYYCTFKNTGDKPIGIDRIVNPTRTSVKYSKEMIQPGAQGQIEIKLQIQDISTGDIRKTFIIYTSDKTKTSLLLLGTISNEIPNKQRRKDKIEWFRTFEKGKYGALNIKGEIIVPPICSKITNIQNGFLAEKNGIKAFYDYTGKCIIPFSKGYTDIRCNTNKTCGTFFSVQKVNYNALCNQLGQVVYHIAENGYMEPFYHFNRFYVILLNENKYKIFDYKKECICTYNSKKGVSSLGVDKEGNICIYVINKKYKILENIKNVIPSSKNPFDQ